MKVVLDHRKMATFGLLGALGCLVGWAVGEGFLAAALPRLRQAPSLASRPEAAPLTAVKQAAVPPPPLPDLSQSAPQAAAPPPLPPPVQLMTTVPEGIFALRTAPNRAQLVARLGGNEESETAVQAGLAWLARHQADDGHWSDGLKCEQGDPCPALSFNDGHVSIAETGLAVLAFQAGGNYYFNDQKYSQHVKNGLDWLVKQQGSDGRLFGVHTWYQHGIATFALAEACAVDLANNHPPDARYLDAATRAIKFMEDHQYAGGGWQYELDSPGMGDTSVTGWQVLALKSALEAKIDVAPMTMRRVQDFFERCANPATGQTRYTIRAWSTDLTTAVGLIVQEFILKQPKSPLALKAVEHLKQRAPQLGPSGDFYTLYNGTLSMFLAGGDAWKQWNLAVRDAVVKRQEREGCVRGSWTSNYGRTLDTAWAVLTLEVYYRYATEQAEPLPSLQLAVLPEVRVYTGDSTAVRVRIAREHVSGAIRLRCEGDLRDITVAGVEVPAGQDVATLNLTTASAAEAGTRELRILAEAEEGSVTSQEKFVARLEPLPSVLRVSVSPEVVLLPGASNHVLSKVFRERFDGPVRLRCEGDLRGLRVAEVEIAADQDQATLDVTAESTAEGGRRELRLVAAAGDLTAQSTFQVQVKAVPPVLHISAPREVTLGLGSSNSVPVRIGRERFQGPVEFRLKSDVAGFSLPPVKIAEDRDEGELQLTADKLSAPGRHALLLQAVSGPFRAETDLTVVIPAPPAFPWSLLLVIGMWTGLLAVGLSLALAAGQSWYLSKRLPRWQVAMTLAGGGMLAGVVAGGIGQGLFSLLARAEVLPQVGFLVGWVLLGSLLGRGIGFFIPNLHGGKAALAGAVGGLLGAAAFIGISAIGDFAGRCVGAAILGCSIGLVVALIEAAFREAWLEMRYGSRETRTVNLGTQPIQIGGASYCTIWTPHSQPVALTFWIDNGRVTRHDVPANLKHVVDTGHRDQVGSLEIVVRTGRQAMAGKTLPPVPPPPPPPLRKAPPPPPDPPPPTGTTHSRAPSAPAAIPSAPAPSALTAAAATPKRPPPPPPPPPPRPSSPQ